MEVTSRVLAAAGFKTYRSMAEIKKAAAAARVVLRRRSVSRLEVIQYFLACAQAPEHDLHGLAQAIELGLTGSVLEAKPRRPYRRRTKPRPSSATGTVVRRRTLLAPRQGPYDRYGQPLPGDATRAELAMFDLEYEANEDAAEYHDD